MTKIIFVVAAPRSGTGWLCNLVSDKVGVLHEPMADCRDLEELRERIEGLRRDTVLVADTSFLLHPPQLLSLNFPTAEYVFIQPDWTGYLRSLSKMSREEERAGIHMLPSLKEGEAEWRNSVPFVNLCYDFIDSYYLCSHVYDFVCGEPLPKERWEFLREMKVEIMWDRMIERIQQMLAREKASDSTDST